MLAATRGAIAAERQAMEVSMRAAIRSAEESAKREHGRTAHS